MSIQARTSSTYTPLRHPGPMWGGRTVRVRPRALGAKQANALHCKRPGPTGKSDDRSVRIQVSSNLPSHCYSIFSLAKGVRISRGPSASQAIFDVRALQAWTSLRLPNPRSWGRVCRLTLPSKLYSNLIGIDLGLVMRLGNWVGRTRAEALESSVNHILKSRAP